MSFAAPHSALRAFVAQHTLEAWVDAGDALVESDHVDIRNRGRFQLEPAVRFLRRIEGATLHELAGKVLSEARITALGGELLGDSVVFGDVAYEVQPGFVATREEG